MSDYLREQFTTKHPWTHEDDCSCDFDAGRKCFECAANAERERWQLEGYAACLADVVAYLEAVGSKWWAATPAVTRQDAARLFAIEIKRGEAKGAANE